MSRQLPVGWEERRNNLSERDMMLGAAAAGTFSSKGIIANAYEDGTEHHKTSEEVEAFWMKQIEKERAEAAAAGEKQTPGSLPWGFEHRAKVRDAEAKAYAAAAATTTTARAQKSDGPSIAPIAFASADRHSQPSTTMTTTGSDVAPDDATTTTTTGSSTAEVALVRVTTHAMEQLAAALTAKPTRLDADDRAKFAAAMKRCMDAVMHCR